MSNRIDGDSKGGALVLEETTIKGDPNAEIDESATVSDTKKADDADRTGSSSDSSAEIFEDVYNEYVPLAHRDAISDERPPRTFMDEPSGPPKSFKAGVVAAGGRIDFEPTARQKLEQHPHMDAVLDVLGDETIDASDLVSEDTGIFAGIFKTKGELEDRVLGKADLAKKGELAALCEDPDALESFLLDELGKRDDLQPGSDEARRLSRLAVEEIQSSAASVVTEAAASRVEGAIDKTNQFLERIEQPQTKRTIALMVSDTSTPKDQKIASARRQFGLSQEAAEDLIDGMHGENPQDAAEHLQSWIDDRKSGLEDLRDRTQSSAVTNALMTSDMFENTRNQALEASVEAYGPGVERAFEATRARVESDNELEDDAIMVIQIATAVGMTAMTGGAAGAAIGAATAAAQSAPGVAMAQADVGAGHASDLAKTSDGTRGERAEFERNVEVGKAIASVAFGAATSGAKASGRIEADPEAVDFLVSGVFAAGTERADYAINDLFD